MPAGLAGGASACVRDIGRGLHSVSSSDSISTSHLGSSVSSDLSLPSTPASVPEVDSLSSSITSDNSVPPPPSYFSLFPPSPPTTTLDLKAKAGQVLNEVALAALSGGVTRVGIGPASPSSSTSSISLLEDVDAASVTDSDSDSVSIVSSSSTSPSEAAHDLASTIYPNLDLSGRSGTVVTAIPVEVTSANDDWIAWDGFVLNEEEKDERALYVRSKNYDGVNVRENVIALLELADEALECDSVVICLDKNNPDLSSILHSLLYVGGTIVHANPADGPERLHNSDYVLVGLDL